MESMISRGRFRKGSLMMGASVISAPSVLVCMEGVDDRLDLFISKSLMQAVMVSLKIYHKLTRNSPPK